MQSALQAVAIARWFISRDVGGLDQGTQQRSFVERQNGCRGQGILEVLSARAVVLI